tara:strand:- start:216 stop:755 length:540 start_codon:yes stop_codon:yes gene_type:complete
MLNNIALFGGSFNPPHIGHTLAISYVLSQYDVSRVIVVPVFRHAFDKELAPYHHRKKMVYHSMRWLPSVTFSDIEQELNISRTLDTIEALYKRYPNTRIRLMAGSDIVEKRNEWHRFDKIEELAPPIIFPRVGTANVPNVSSTFIRNLIKDDKEMLDPRFRETIAPHVRVYIRKNHLYV